MKIAICDDDKKDLAHILSMLDDYQLQQTADFTYQAFESSTELAVHAMRERSDVYLLDVVMPGLNGMELAKEIRSHDNAADIIFLTSSTEFAVESYSVKAANYLVKPIHRDQLYAALDDIIQTRSRKTAASIIVKSRDGVHKIRICDIVYVEALNRKVIYHLKNKEEIICAERFASVCDLLMQHPEFLLIHRSFLVNMNYIRSISTTELCLQNDIRVPLAQRRSAQIKQLYLAFQMEESL